MSTLFSDRYKHPGIAISVLTTERARILTYCVLIVFISKVIRLTVSIDDMSDHLLRQTWTALFAAQNLKYVEFWNNEPFTDGTLKVTKNTHSYSQKICSFSKDFFGSLINFQNVRDFAGIIRIFQLINLTDRRANTCWIFKCFLPRYLSVTKSDKATRLELFLSDMDFTCSLWVLFI